MAHEYFGPGDDREIIVAAGAVILDTENRVLLVRHRPERGGFWRGKWICPGGRVDLGETLAAAVIREVAEETGLALTIDHWLPPFDRVVVEEGRVRLHVIYLDCLGHASGELIPDSDVGEARWFTREQIVTQQGELHEDTQRLLSLADILTEP